MLPSTTEFLQRFGERLRLARLRRRLTAKQVAERAGMAPMTMRNLERGSAGVTMGAYLAVMQVLGIEKDLGLLGAADPMGRELQDARLTIRGRPLASVEPARRGQTTADKSQPRPRKEAGRWVEKSGFTSARNLVDLIDSKGPASKKRR
ncbi:MAG: helix-turn-helix domain-containing protein [Ferrovum sp.]|nr:helix-turn-helix domain-containing protein [Ferrovum sp.]